MATDLAEELATLVPRLFPTGLMRDADEGGQAEHGVRPLPVKSRD